MRDKIFIVGAGFAGKTALIEKLSALGKDIEVLTPEEALEKGINILEKPKLPEIEIPELKIVSPFAYPSGREKRRERRKQQRKQKKYQP